VLLAAWTRRRARARRFVELGSATGAVSLMLALRFPPPFHVTGVEIQPELVELAQRNRTGMEDRVAFVRGDLRDPSLLPPCSFDGLVVNPPYEAAGRGRPSPDASRAIARHSEGRDGASCSIDDVALAASRLLKDRGRLFAVFRADRMASFVVGMSARGLVPKRSRTVHPRAGEAAALFLIDCVKGGGEGLTVEPPLVVMGEDGSYTSELLRAYELDGI
ncbi:MAG: methyltransferase domain-containing protein, partial [Synergistaceae bacterium]|nr:methyltransferase domain-containing protein [Synergistaceae bacterium]